MAKIDWNDTLVVDLPQIDEQHRKLINLSNSMLQAMVVGKGQAVLEETFGELKKYTEYHFADEEKLMEQLEYPAIAEHRELHGALIEQVMDFSARLDKVSPTEAVDFLNGWIVNHIREEDVKVSLFAKNK